MCHQSCQKIADLAAENQHLKERIAWYERQLFSAKSERHVPEENSGFLPGMTPDQPAEESSSSTVKNHQRKAFRNQTGWQEFPKNLPTEEIIVKVKEENRYDTDGKKLQFIGYDEITRLAWRKNLFLKVYKIEKLASPNNPLEGVIRAQRPASVLDSTSGKGKFDTSFIVHCIVSKVVDHLPFYRQSKMYKRQGIYIDRSTLTYQLKSVAELFKPLYDLMTAKVMECEIIHADESPIRLIEPGRGKCKKAYIWCRKSGIGPPFTVFYFDKSRGSQVATKLLKNYCGTIIRDDYSGYNAVEKDSKGKIVHAACWAHARRKFFDAQKSDAKVAEITLNKFKLLYDLERQAKEKSSRKATEKELFNQRKRCRKKSAVIVEEVFTECLEIKMQYPPSDLMHKAAKYALKLQQPLKRFLHDPKINIDNNPAENAIRPLALGRKNWLFAGSESGGQNLAILMSFAVSCEQNEINVQNYFEDILERIHTTPKSKLSELLPSNWQQPN